MLPRQPQPATRSAEAFTPGGPGARREGRGGEIPVHRAEDPAALLVDRACCPLCGSDDRATWRVVHAFRDIPVVRCGREGCGMMFSARVAGPGAQHLYYAEHFGSTFHQRGQRINASVNLRVLARMSVPSGRGGDGPVRLLDVGTGYGYLPWLLEKRWNRGGGPGSVRCVGVEVSSQEVRYARERLGVDVREGLMSAAGLEPGSFDVGACFEVIEHVDRPVDFARELAGFVRPGGWVVVNTDNFGAPAVRRLGPEYPKWIPHSHINHFEPRTLASCLRRAGLTVEGVWSFTPWETRLRVARMLGRSPRPAPECFDLRRTLRTEMRRGLPLYRLRLAVSVAWVLLTLRRHRVIDGEPRAPDAGTMMFMLARRPQSPGA